LAQIEKQYGSKVRFVYKDNPLPFHARAEPATEVALEVRARKGDAAFWKFHDAVLADNQHLDDDALAQAAAEVGLDKNAALAAIQAKKHHAEIEATAALADELEANGTPTFFVNGRRITGAQPFEQFATLIDAELAHASGMVKQGTPASAVYEAIIKTGKSDAPTAVAVPAPTAASPSRGPANAKIVVQYFGDFQCPYCKRVEPTLVELEKAYPNQVRIVWRNLPLPMHERAPLAAEAAMEAFAQKGSAGFWAFHDELMADQTATDRAGLERTAAKVGLDLARFVRALDTHAHAAEVARDAKIAAAANITGTPGFTINGYFLSGAQQLVKFKRIADYSLSTMGPRAAPNPSSPSRAPSKKP
jgi:protein-disulfide isomerase